jgi:undecaprenyl phosphate-alpha-L-ara4N flippase subunit ArnE
MSIGLGFALLVLVSLLTAVGQICFKKAAVSRCPLWQKFMHPHFVVGVVLFLGCPVISSLAAKVVDFSLMYAMTSLNFVFVLLLSRWVLKEQVDWPKIAGVCTIVIGLLVMVVN